MSLHPVRFGRSPQTLVPDKSTIRVRRWALATLCGATALGALWGAAATSFILFKDDFAAKLIHRQMDQQFAYERRIAELRLHIDRMTTRQLVDQDSVEAQVAELLSRQSAIETRHAMVSMLAADTGSAAPDAAGIGRKRLPAEANPIAAFAPVEAPALPPAIPTSAKPSPIIELPPVLRGVPAMPGAGGNDRTSAVVAPGEQRLPAEIAAIRRSLTTIAADQVATLGKIERATQKKLTGLRSAFAEAGIDPGRLAPRPDKVDGVGGPLVPVDAMADQGTFEAAIDRVKGLVQTAAKLKAAALGLPVRRPLVADAGFSSTFGTRLDPFTRGMAMHTGLDFRAESGTAVRATGAGVVTAAEYRGGYGKLVEIDHGNGLVTRYGHLSAILVTEGQTITVGAVVGRVGSTGRSTGPHLHYETRVNGEAVDPQRLLKVGERHRGLL